MRHLGEVGDDGITADIFAKCEGQFVVAIAVFAAREDLAEADHLAVVIGELDADDRASGDSRNTRGKSGHGTGDIIGEADHTRGFQAWRGLELIHCDNRARTDRDDLAFDAVVIEYGLEHTGVGL